MIPKSPCFKVNCRKKGFELVLLSIFLVVESVFAQAQVKSKSTEKAPISSCKEASELVQQATEIGDSGQREKELYRSALKLCPTMAEAYHNLGIVMFQEGEYEEAVKLLSEASKLNGLMETKLALASAQFRAGKGEESEQTYRSVLKVDASQIKALQGLV